MIPRRRLLATTLLAAAAAGVPVRAAAQVHHTVTADDDPTPAATVRAIYVAHTVAHAFAPALPDLRREVAALLRPAVPQP